jgi:riboflavin synthase
MFTGLIEDVGTLAQLQRTQKEVRLTITSPVICADLAIGDSVSVNGACLTVVQFNERQFTVLATAETLRRTALSQLTISTRVNLERALRVNGRLGGHIVLGHVDGVGRIRSMTHEGESVRLEVTAPNQLHPWLVPKGSIAVDGISLTIADLLPDGFWVALIPHTLGATTLQYRRPGDLVNLETDIIGKYVARLMGISIPGGPDPIPDPQSRGPLTVDLSLDVLRKHGFA